MEGERLSQHPKFNIEDTNIALLGSDLERRVREHAGDKEVAWETAGKAPGLDVWRVEHFRIAKWPRERHGTFYDGDSYLVLHTYKNHNETDALAYDLHFWLGKDTSQDEAGTAAYKTVELDDYLNGQPVQYREVQGFESSHFLSYFPHFITLHGGISTGFHHVSAPPPAEMKKLYKIQISQPPYNHLVVREVPAEASSIVQGAVYVLDEGTKALQFNTKESVGKERFKAAEFVRLLVYERQSQPQVIVYDEGASGAGIFLSEFESDAVLPAPVKPRQAESTKASLYRLSDASGRLVFESMGGFTGLGSLSSGDVYFIDNTADICQPAIYVWIGKSASLNERRLVMQYAQQYLYKAGAGAAVSIVKIAEGMENNRFLINLGGSA